jgi:multiple sugar transport system permease protein
VFGLQKVQWLNDTKWALASVMAMDVWASIGYYAIIFLAGLEAVPKDLYESASVDGATKFQQFFYITIPNIRNIILFVVLINTIRSYQIFTEIATMTQGNPLNSTNTIVYDLYETAFHQFDFGYASAMAYVLFVIILVLSLVYNKVFYEKGAQ